MSSRRSASSSIGCWTHRARSDSRRPDRHRNCGRPPTDVQRHPRLSAGKRCGALRRHGLEGVRKAWRDPHVDHGRNLDVSLAARAMHGMIASVGVATLGYQTSAPGTTAAIRTIAVDPQRAPFVRMEFELYATGNYSFPELRDSLTDAGLRTWGTRRYGPRPVSMHTVGKDAPRPVLPRVRQLRRNGV